MRNFFLALPAFATMSVIPLLTFGCSPVDKNKKEDDDIKQPITKAEIEEGSILFYETLFNSNYFQQILLETKYEDVNQNLIINFAKSHPELANLDQQTQTIINQDLQKIKLVTQNENKKIILEVKDIVYEHQLMKFNNQDAYTFKENKIVDIDVNKLHSFEDLFNVFGDIWNLKAKYNSLVDSPYTQIYDYQFSNTSIHNQNISYLKQRAKINNIIANVYAWNFDYEINFTNGTENYNQFNQQQLQENYQQLASLLDLYNDNNYYVDTNRYSEGPYQIISDGISPSFRFKSNFPIYPTLKFSNLSLFIKNQDKLKDGFVYEKYNPIYISGLMPENSYIFYEHILSQIFNDFANFIKSDIFTTINPNNFDQIVKIYQFDEEQNKPILFKYPEVDYLNAPINIDSKLIANQDSFSYVEYMFAQWLYNSKAYVEFEELILSEESSNNINLDIKKRTKNAEQEEDPSYPDYDVMMPSQKGNDWIIEEQTISSFRDEDTNLFGKWFVKNFNLQPKYGSRATNRSKELSYSHWIGLNIFYKDEEFKVNSKYIEGIIREVEILEIDDTKLKNNASLMEDESNNILDVIDLKFPNYALANLIKQKPDVLKIISQNLNHQSKKGELSVELNLSNSSIYYMDNEENLHQKFSVDFKLAFDYDFAEYVQTGIKNWNCTIQNQDIKFLD